MKKNQKEFNINDVMKRVIELREESFISEHDFQFIMGVAIKELYKNATVVMEYEYPEEARIKNKSRQNPKKVRHDDKIRQYVDIMVILNNKWYPIELKYNCKKCDIKIAKGIEPYPLKDHSCETDLREKYCMDIERLLKFFQSDCKVEKIEEGYAIFLTNYEEFRFEAKSRQKIWLLYEETISDGVKEINQDYHKEMYDMVWYYYNKSNNKPSKFSYLITTIKKNKKIK